MHHRLCVFYYIFNLEFNIVVENFYFCITLVP